MCPKIFRLFLLICSISTGFCHAQHILPLTTSPVDTHKVRAYYDEINQAELAIIYNHLDSADNWYQQAFSLKFPNAKDLYNAALLAYYSEDSADAELYFNTLAYKGLPKNYFKDSLSHPDLYRYMLRNYDSFYEVGTARPKILTAQKFWNQFYQRDQKYRKLSTETEESDTVRLKMLSRKIQESDSINMAALKQYISQNGFPGFEQLGFGFLGSFPDLLNSPLNLFIWHWRPAETPIDSVVLQAIKNGLYPPQEWAMLCIGRGDPYGTQLYKTDMNFSEDSLRHINQLRLEIYLPNLRDYQKIFVIAQVLNDAQKTEYNPNLYGKGAKYKHQFVLLPNMTVDYPWGLVIRKQVQVPGN